MTFPGFPSRAKSTPIPDVFFTDLLPQLTESRDLAVVLCAFHTLAGKKGFPRYITRTNLAAEPALASASENRSLPPQFLRENTKVPNELHPETAPADVIARGLARAVELGILLPLTVEREGERIDLYFLNAPADRRGLEAVRTGAVDLGAVVRQQPAAPQRSNIFTLYESLVGTLSPLIADELAEAERLYPPEWLEAAFREAASQNARSWRYVSRILERWAIEGPDHATTERGAAEDRYFRGKYGKILKQRLQP
ncbi:MAG: DnaD domain protein [Chloroflexi bacterium]|nr:DnaD domain protein [Chloroflexota bacterium]